MLSDPVTIAVTSPTPTKSPPAFDSTDGKSDLAPTYFTVSADDLSSIKVKWEHIVTNRCDVNTLPEGMITKSPVMFRYYSMITK